ncbi:MAG TPA: hypothetical protein VFI25_07455 [Planctomycetota bacterium]|jgi:hypothetical protein|nr:hypothetical protein [Planctomycetota bacterium]
MLPPLLLAALPLPGLPGGDGPADARLVRALHLDLLGRTPTRGEWSEALDAPRERLLDRLVGGRSFWQAWFEDELYYFLLIDGFRPTSPAVVEIPELLADGSLTVPEAIHRILLSPNFSGRNPGADTFVTVVLEQCLGMTVQDNPTLLAAGKRMYDGHAVTIFGQSGRGQADVVKIVLEQPAFLRRLAERQWTRLYGALFPREEARRAEERLAADPRAFGEIVREWAGSPAYAERLGRPRAKSPLQLARSLFVDLLDRPPTDEEFRWTRNATRALSDPEPLRAVLSRLLLSSGKAGLPKSAPEDPASWVREQFLRLLAREPSARELRTFVGILSERGSGPSEVIEALVTHPEYGYY